MEVEARAGEPPEPGPKQPDEWDKLVAFFNNLRGHWYTGDSVFKHGRQHPGEKERMMFSADVVRQVVRKFRARARRGAK